MCITAQQYCRSIWNPGCSSSLWGEFTWAFLSVCHIYTSVSVGLTLSLHFLTVSERFWWIFWESLWTNWKGNHNTANPNLYNVAVILLSQAKITIYWFFTAQYCKWDISNTRRSRPSKGILNCLCIITTSDDFYTSGKMTTTAFVISEHS